MIFKSDPYCEKGILIVMDMGDFEDKGEQESPEAARDYVQTLAQWTRRHGSDWCKDCSIGWTK